MRTIDWQRPEPSKDVFKQMRDAGLDLFGLTIAFGDVDFVLARAEELAQAVGSQELAEAARQARGQAKRLENMMYLIYMALQQEGRED